jgi:hypothetical protein
MTSAAPPATAATTGGGGGGGARPASKASKSLLALDEDSYLRGPGAGPFAAGALAAGPSALFAEKLTVYRSGAPAAAPPPAPSRTPSRAGPDQGSKLGLSRRALHSLPALMKLLLLLAELGGDFMTIKFNDAFWPEMNKMLICLSMQEISGYASGRSHASAGPGPGAGSFRSVDAVCKEALLDCLRQLAGGGLGRPSGGGRGAGRGGAGGGGGGAWCSRTWCGPPPRARS